MTGRFAPNEQVCLLNANARCSQIWVSKSDGLLLAHFQTLGQMPITGKDNDAAADSEQISAPTGYEKCARGCLGLG